MIKGLFHSLRRFVVRRKQERYKGVDLSVNAEVSTDAKCLAAFVKEMNKYADRLGMSETHFVNPSGMNESSHYSCAKDLARMTMFCTKYKKLMEFWGQTSYSVFVDGPNARTISGYSSYTGDNMTTVENCYHIIGGKSGTWIVDSSNHIENLCLVCKSKVDDVWLVGCILYNANNPTAGTKDNRGVPFKQMLDWLEDYRQDSATETQAVQASYCSAWVIPQNGLAYYEKDLEMVGKNSTTRAIPASCTKLMTAMVALDYISINETIIIKSGDIKPGSGDTYYVGDTITFGDAIFAMLLPSSNTLAMAIARTVGAVLLNYR
jgi:D-alanyl-D-alanine carboxypeptidase